MNRRFVKFLTFAVCVAPFVIGCSPQDPSASGTAGTTGSTPATTGSTGASSATDTTGTTGTNPAPANNGAPQAAPKDGDNVAVIDTADGQMVMMFYPDKAPIHVENFMNLAKKGFYDGTRFHRCVPGFMIQGGDPKSKDLSKASEWGTGGNMGPDGKEITVRAEFNDVHHDRGIVSMARSQDPDSASSQFYIVTTESGFLDHQYTAFGKVISGMDVADKIVKLGPPREQDPEGRGTVDPKKAVVVKSIKIVKWPLK